MRFNVVFAYHLKTLPLILSSTLASAQDRQNTFICCVYKPGYGLNFIHGVVKIALCYCGRTLNANFVNFSTHPSSRAMIILMTLLN
jgi:hypothetical protein